VRNLVVHPHSLNPYDELAGPSSSDADSDPDNASASDAPASDDASASQSTNKTTDPKEPSDDNES
jgi:hypothetical protein